MSLKDFWPFPSFRDGQEAIVQQIEDAWDSHDVIVCNLPTAFGKTPVSVAIQNWQLAEGKSAAYTVPNNVLREQAIEEWSHLKTVRAMDSYWIEKYSMSEKEFRQRIYKWGPKDSEYKRDLNCVKRVGTPICVNYYSYIAHKLQRNVVIVDEAHLLLKTLQDFGAKKIWHHKHKYPLNLRSLEDVKNWVDSLADSKAVEQLKEELTALTPATLVQLGEDMYRGEIKPCLKLIPMSVENQPPIFWPRKTGKIVLVSATLGQEDIQRMGLGTRRVKIIEAPSPIPVDRRAIYRRYVGNMSYATQDANMDSLVAEIKKIRDENEGNGFVHASYGLARKLRNKLNDCDWAVFHDHGNKQDVYDSFAETDPDERKVMIGSGMSEGIDMHEDVARWQAIAKMPYPSLADPAIRWVARNQSKSYQWMVAKDIMQSAGRVCRGPTDYGITFILDNSFEKWYNGSMDQLPRWFREAVQNEEE